LYWVWVYLYLLVFFYNKERLSSFTCKVSVNQTVCRTPGEQQLLFGERQHWPWRLRVVLCDKWLLDCHCGHVLRVCHIMCLSATVWNAFWLGLDRYRAGAWYPILSATAVPMPIPGCTNFLYWKCDFVRGIGVCRLYMYVGYMCENTV